MLDEKTMTVISGIEAEEVINASAKWIKKLKEETSILENRGKIAEKAEDTIGLIAISAEIVVLNQMAEAIGNAADKANKEKIRCLTELQG